MTSALEEELLLRTPASAAPTDWSADGSVIVYEQNDFLTASDIWLLPPAGAKRQPTPFLRTKFNEGQGVLSADGRWMAYTSDESGRFEVYVQPNPSTGEKWQVSTVGGSQPRWRKDGRELFYLDQARSLMAAPTQISPGHFQVGQPQRLFSTRVGFGSDANASVENSLCALTPDGWRFLVSNKNVAADTEPVIVVLNWPLLLKK